jgi:hypothetical protein
MAPHLKKILRDPGAPFGIKLLILEGLGSAPPLPSLQKDIVAVVADPATPFRLKVSAMRAAAQLGTAAGKAVVKIYRSLGESADDLRLRAFILAKFYVGNFSATDVSNLYNTAARSKAKLLSGVLWQIATSIPTHDIPPVLDAVASGREPDATKNGNNRAERERFIERLLIRAVEERSDGVSGQRMWVWLEMRSTIRGDHNNRRFDGIKPLLAERPELASAIFEAAIEDFKPATVLWRFRSRLSEYLPFPLSAHPLRLLSQRLMAGIQDRAKYNALYDSPSLGSITVRKITLTYSSLSTSWPTLGQICF